MEKIIVDLVRIQVALLDGWVCGLLHVWRASQHLMAVNVQLLQHPALHRWHNVLPSGADWLDHYGKRSHDIDIEHLR